MKSIIKYFIFFSWFVFFFGCDDPQPTSLVEDEDPIAIEVITKNPAEPTSFGVDSTGLDENPARFTNVITVAGIKQTFQGISFRSSFAQAAFFDKTKPVYGFHGKLLGYSTLTPGSVFFNNQKAQLRQFTIKHGVNRDTVLGLRYVLHKRGFLGDPFNFEYNSNINFRFVPDISSPISFDIATPPEIFLNYKFSGSNDNKNLNLVLDWNAAYLNNFEIIISIVDDQRDIVFPLYKIKTADDGKFVMPKKLLQELAVRYNKIAFTLTRKYEKQHNSGISELFIVSQSINSISVELP